MAFAYPYALTITLLGPLVYTPNGGFLPLFRCENRAGTAMIVQMLSSGLCVVFGAVLFPTVGKRLGLVTAALATVLSLAVTAVYTLLNYCGVFKRSVLRFRGHVRIVFRQIGTIVTQAFPQFLNAVPYHVGVWMCNWQITRHLSDSRDMENYAAAMGMVNKLGFLVL